MNEFDMPLWLWSIKKALEYYTSINNEPKILEWENKWKIGIKKYKKWKIEHICIDF